MRHFRPHIVAVIALISALCLQGCQQKRGSQLAVVSADECIKSSQIDTLTQSDIAEPSEEKKPASSRTSTTNAHSGNTDTGIDISAVTENAAAGGIDTNGAADDGANGATGCAGANGAAGGAGGIDASYTPAQSLADVARLRRNTPAKVFSSYRIVTDSIGVFFRQNVEKLDPRYRSNPTQLATISKILNSGHRIDSIRIYAFASPEGVYERNQYLSRHRAEALKSWIFKNTSKEILQACDFKLFPLGEDWIGFRREIYERYDRADRDKVLSILDDDSIKPDTKKWRLKQLSHGETWRHLIAYFAPKQRQAASVIVYYRQLPIQEVVIPYEPVYIEDEEPITEEEEIEIPDIEIDIEAEIIELKTIAAVKTNLLFDAVTALNIEVEVPIGDHFSVLLEHNFPWWLSKDNRRCLEFLCFGGEFRYWFGKKGHGVLKSDSNASLTGSRATGIPGTTASAAKPAVIRDQRLQGHFVGLYAYSGKTDLQWDLNGCYQAQFFSVGLSYGFALPISDLFNLEFSIAAGYARIPYQHYIPTEDWQTLFRDRYDSGTLSYFGPTKLEVSLVMPIRVKKRRKL